MVRRWISYLAAWSGCLIFYYLYREWLSCFLLVAVSCLPPVSLLLSLPAMLTARMEISVPESCSVGEDVRMDCRLHCRFPVALWRVKLPVQHTLSGRTWVQKATDPLPTDHCGVLRIRVQKPRIYDFLGLVRLSFGKEQHFSTAIRPAALKPAQLPELGNRVSVSWRPRRGGGFSENHEMRLYRPGDSLQHIHWKLSAKTGKLILREAMEAHQSRMLLLLDLSGQAEELNRKLGRLLWLGDHLLEKDLKFEVRALTGKGIDTYKVADADDLDACLLALLDSPQAKNGSVLQHAADAAWWYLIGGDADEEA